MKKMLCLVIVSYAAFMLIGMSVAARDVAKVEEGIASSSYVEKGY